ncbi:MAG: hypothetical protein ABIH46_11470, partial [Chloroflexota bacterium]
MVDGILQVSLSLRPEVADIGVGEPLIAEGTVWLFGLPFGAPVLIAVHEAKNSQVLSGSVGWGFSAPFFGAFRIPIPTEGWSQGERAFTAVVIPLADSPVTSPSASKRIVAPRYSASLQTNWKSGEKNPLTIRQDQGDRVYCRWTVENTGNVSDTYDCVLVLGLPAVQTYTYRADNIVSLAPGESSSHIVPVDVPVGAPLGLYDGYCRIYGEPDGGVFVQDEQGDVVEVVEAPPPPVPVVEYSVLSVEVWSERGGWAAPGNLLPIWDMETFNGRVTFEHKGPADRVQAVLRVDLGGGHSCWAIGSWQNIPEEANWTTHTITCGPGATFVFGG